MSSYDAIVIGAGVSGLYQLYRLRELGLSVRGFEAGSDVGGTWYWNRYPGARFDSESYTYGYSFSDDLLQEWEWSERFAAQPETLRYLQHVADKFDLRRDFQFDARVQRATFDDTTTEWTIELADGTTASARFLVAAIGALSVPQLPNVPGLDTFAGKSFHTAEWPHEPVDFRNQRVAVIGTGATGVQVIQEIAKTAATLTVFQRRPNWCAPLHNGPLGAAEQRAIKANYDEIFATCQRTFSSFVHDVDPRTTDEATPEEREALWEKLYGEPGFGIWLSNFRDILLEPTANALITEYIARKIRERVHDPVVAERLIPKDHGFGTRRLPLETKYYEAYNQDNVELVDVQATPIERVTPSGITTRAADYEFDIIVYATGFDAITGAFERLELRGEGGQLLRDKWATGPRTYLGLLYAGFPNLLAIVGPHNSVTFANMPRGIEHNVEWITDLIAYMREHGYTRVEATPEAETEWTNHVNEVSQFFLLTQVDSWFTGVNKNRADRQERRIMVYAGGAPAFRDRCAAVAAAGYEGLELR